MNLNGSTRLTATALPTYRTRLITLAPIYSHLIRMCFVAVLDRIELQPFSTRADALILLRIVGKARRVVGFILWSVHRFRKIDEYGIVLFFGRRQLGCGEVAAIGDSLFGHASHVLFYLIDHPYQLIVVT